MFDCVVPLIICSLTALVDLHLLVTFLQFTPCNEFPCWKSISQRAIIHLYLSKKSIWLSVYFTFQLRPFFLLFDVFSFSVNLFIEAFRKILSQIKIQHFPISEQSHCTVVMKTSGSRKYRIRQGLDLLQIYPWLVDFWISFCPPLPSPNIHLFYGSRVLIWKEHHISSLFASLWYSQQYLLSNKIVFP